MLFMLNLIKILQFKLKDLIKDYIPNAYHGLQCVSSIFIIQFFFVFNMIISIFIFFI
uniref:Uncharacterized protein n=1 Tax=Pleurostomum flabellatum TaxID=405751 RepID=A0A7T0Q4V3_9EUKA|nr:hypothetical protein J6731_mgp43 [Pleurostomum flabellatum]QPL15637.1 hypothetical protein [Pleurostomum flabellatum]